MRTMGWVLGAAAILGLAAWALLDSSGDTSDPAAPSDKRRAAREDRPALEGRFVDPVEALRREMAEPLPAPVQGSPVDAPDGFDPKRHILLRVLNAQGEPLLRGEVRITVRPPNDGSKLPLHEREWRHTATFRNGILVVDRTHVPRVPRLQVRPLGESTRISDPFPPTEDLSLPLVVDDLDPQDVEWDVRLEEGRRYAGVVRDADGDPVEGAVLRVLASVDEATPTGRRQGIRVVAQVTSDEDGNYRTPPLPLEDLVLEAQTEDGRPLARHPLAAGQTGETTYDVAAQFAEVLRFRILDEHGRRVQGVGILPQGGHRGRQTFHAATRSDEDGELDLEGSFANGPLDLVVFRPMPQGRVELSYAVRVQVELGRPVVLTLRPYVAVSLRVLGPSGEPVAGFPIASGLDRPGLAWASRRTDKEGRLQGWGLPGRIVVSLVDRQAGLHGRGTLDLHAPASDCQIQLGRLHRLVARVTNAAPGGRLDATWLPRDGTTWPGRVDEEGRLQWSGGGLPVGAGLLRVRERLHVRDGEPVLPRRAALVPMSIPQEAPVEVVLQPAGDLFVTATREPPQGTRAWIIVEGARAAMRRLPMVSMRLPGPGDETTPTGWILDLVPRSLRCRVEIRDAQDRLLAHWDDVTPGGAPLEWTPR